MVLQSEANVHGLWWTSQPRRPSHASEPGEVKSDALPVKVSSVLQDVPFIQLYPEVHKATPVGLAFEGSSGERFSGESLVKFSRNLML